MDRLEIDYHLTSRADETTVDEVAHRLEKLLTAEDGHEEPVFVSKSMRGPFVDVTIVCHVRNADEKWSKIKPHLMQQSVSGDITVRKIEGTNESSAVLFSDS